MQSGEGITPDFEIIGGRNLYQATSKAKERKLELTSPVPRTNRCGPGLVFTRSWTLGFSISLEIWPPTGSVSFPAATRRKP